MPTMLQLSPEDLKDGAQGEVTLKVMNRNSWKKIKKKTATKRLSTQTKPQNKMPKQWRNQMISVVG